MLTLDHLAISATDLAAGTAAVEAALGVAMAGGGEHARMGTHNRLLGLGDLYLEVIAVDPAAPVPKHPRWFGLDRFDGRPRITNWIARTDDLPRTLALAPPGTGHPLEFARGDFRWQMAVPQDGQLPFDGAFPALIQWFGPRHPTATLPDSGVRLTRLSVIHPRAAEVRAALAGLIADPRLEVRDGATPGFSAVFQTPDGERSLS